MDCTNNLRVVFGDCALGVHGTKEGKDFQFIFSYDRAGGFESLCIEEKEWLYRVPKPTFWRALTCNDRGGGFQYRSGMWLAADMFPMKKQIAVQVDGKDLGLPIAPINNQFTENEGALEVQITYTYEIITEPRTETQVTYLVKANGDIDVSVHYFGKLGLPEMPAFGLRFILPTMADGYVYEGLSGETYPDRKAGGVEGVYEVSGLPITPYIVPQECQMHMDTSWVEILRTTELDNRNKEKKQTGLKIVALDDKFAFSCLPYTAEELENALHLEELPPARRTVLCVYGAVRGVGGIDSWGADVEEAYRISAEQDMTFSFGIRF